MASESPRSGYLGRFAPSPTGPLHFGSLLAAVASYLEARCHRGRWLLRIEDIDPPRAQAGADLEILKALEAYGFEWDGGTYYQSRRVEAHRSIVERLVDSGRAYACGCSRQDLANCPRGPLGIIYPGRCRNGCVAPEVAIRLRTDDHAVAFTDRLQGPQRQRLESESGDFVILRRDGRIAYQLAVVADDHDQGITDVVRGIDLLESTPRQIFLQQLLGYTTPAYAHIPVAENRAGQKLGKSTGAPAIPLEEVRPTLVAALGALRQQPPDGLADANLDTVWEWATDRWSIDRLAGRKAIDELPNTEVPAAQRPGAPTDATP
jgi:glutamyl-Q tRNA(Asp) synthetase